MDTQQFIVFKNPSQENLIKKYSPYYKTENGVAYLEDSLNILKDLPAKSINLVVTSPPYALHFKKAYGNVAKSEYVEWIKPFGKEIFRVLKDDGSFVLNIGGSYNKGTPTKSLYHFKVLISLVEEVGFNLAQECFWYNPAKLPVPAEWVTVRRVRIKESVEYVWWLSKTPHPKADNTKVLKPYSEDMIRLNKRGVKTTVRPSGHAIHSSFDKIKSGGAIPSNVIEENGNLTENLLRFGNNSANDKYTMGCKGNEEKIHPARFPELLPEFFIKLLTDIGDIVLDPFAGSNTTGSVCERLQRKWIAVESEEDYLRTSKYRFNGLII
jgi:site-specific DNA-methyltransferase (cytosine-N4-specific)